MGEPSRISRKNEEMKCSKCRIRITFMRWGPHKCAVEWASAGLTTRGIRRRTTGVCFSVVAWPGPTITSHVPFTKRIRFQNLGSCHSSHLSIRVWFLCRALAVQVAGCQLDWIFFLGRRADVQVPIERSLFGSSLLTKHVCPIKIS